MPKVTFVKEKKSVEVPAGSILRNVAKKNGVEPHPFPHNLFPFNCHGNGLCGSCRVIVKKGEDNLSPQGFWEKFTTLLNPIWFFARIGREKTMRLACQSEVQGDCEIVTQPPLNDSEKFWA